jgi:hypothetical protein
MKIPGKFTVDDVPEIARMLRFFSEPMVTNK